MRVSVTRLRQNGRVLRRSELEPAVTGELLVEDFSPDASADRWRRRARLVSPDPYGTVAASLMPPLMDVQLLKADAQGMYLQGVERHSNDGGRTVVEVSQVWLCSQPEELGSKK